MLKDLNQQIEEVKESLWKKRKYEEHIARLNEYIQQQKEKVRLLKNQLQQEESDVEKLEKASFTNIFYTIIGRKLEKLDKEQQELLAAKLKYDEAIETEAEMEQELSALNEKLQIVASADREYQMLLSEKEKLIHDHHSVWSEQLYELADREAELKALLKEYNEAIQAGNTTANSLSTALNSLESARGWSTWDMFGGGMISTAIKHGHMDEAKDHIHKAQKHLRYFQEELQDITNHDQIQLEISGMLTFADFFFDGLIFDWFVHGKITDSITQVESSKKSVDQLLKTIQREKNTKETLLEQTYNDRIELLENAK